MQSFRLKISYTTALLKYNTGLYKDSRSLIYFARYIWRSIQTSICIGVVNWLHSLMQKINLTENKNKNQTLQKRGHHKHIEYLFSVEKKIAKRMLWKISGRTENRTQVSRIQRSLKIWRANRYTIQPKLLVGMSLRRI